MNTADFFELLINNNLLYFSCFVCVCLFYYFLFRKVCFSMLDPIFISLVGSAFGASVVMFLFATSKISSFYFINYLGTQFAFLAGFVFFGKFSPTVFIKSKIRFDNVFFLQCFFIVSFVTFFVSNIIVYATLGIPLFLKSRLDLTVDAGGYGIFTRFAEVSGAVAFYLFLHFIIVEKNVSRLFKSSLFFYLLGHIVVTFLSGSKSSVWFFAMNYFCFLILNKNNTRVKGLLLKLRQYQLKIVLVGLIFAFCIILITFDGEPSGAFLFLAQRIVGYGDVYWHAYPNAYIENLPHNQFFVAVFGSFLGFFRIVDPSTFPEPLGYSLTKMFYTVDMIVGPNPRHNIFGYIYLGPYFSILYSFILGTLLGYIRKLFFNAYSLRSLSKILLLLVYSIFISIETDINYIVFQLNNLLVVIPFLLGISMFIYYFFTCSIENKVSKF
ncbi:O-antigen polymerase [Flavobacterium piscis]|uniref:Oligosaccharide repeat unit polymerase n=1 Tax=Flavobacterium piscis TaxID=1114874 RepID=A0ABX2XMA1_9FLAO|nr:O-antigen polymerase [Flavobacterium piscis]OCB70565.1 hypothetical protein FLP_17975 [Flavobacterium piscis]